uniref:Uncharacterized protein n=1 Tax=Sphaerodactylus townsendi TaxID=933632 RepID=A0ACB8EVA9_9SAUR
MPAPRVGRGAPSHHSSATAQEDNSEEEPSGATGTPAPSSPSYSATASESPTQVEDRDQEGEELQRDEEGDDDSGEGPFRRPPQRAEAENQRLAQEAEQEWRRDISEQMRLDREAFITFASRTHELMAEHTEVVRRLTSESSGKVPCRMCHPSWAISQKALCVCDAKEQWGPLQLISSLAASSWCQSVPHPLCEADMLRGGGAAGPAFSAVATHSQLMQAAHSHLLEAAQPTSPELLTCSQPLELPAAPPPVRGKRAQRMGRPGLLPPRCAPTAS